MPNHIQNRLQVIGDSQEVQKVLNHIKGKRDNGEEIQIDFNKIKPMPQELKIESNAWLAPLENRYLRGESFIGSLEELKKYLDANPERREAVESGFIQGITNFLKYGHATWYGWANDNWGTKWNAYGQNDKRNTSDTIYFQTAWNSPSDLISELSIIFPFVRLHLTYADEDTGSNTGRFMFQNGETIEFEQPDSQSKESYEIYFELNPGEINNYKFVNGKYEFIDKLEEFRS